MKQRARSSRRDAQTEKDNVRCAVGAAVISVILVALGILIPLFQR